MTRWLVRILVAATPVAMPALAHADADDGWYGHGMMWGAGGWFMGPLMILFVLAVLVVAIVIGLRLAGVSGQAGSTGRSAMDVLEERYARGEIDKAEFEERKHTLTGAKPDKPA